MILLPVILALVSGLLISVQGISSSIGGKMVGTPMMIFWLSLVQAIPVLFYAIFSRNGMSLTASLQGWKWFLISGILGIIIIASLNLSISKSDALLVFVLVVLGQIIGSAVADRIGLFGIKVQPIGALKIIAILVIAAGTGLLYYSDNQTKHNYEHHVKKS
jgi:transporter family-2 protein